MEEQREPFEVEGTPLLLHGTVKKLRTVKADKILEAIKRGQNICIEYAVIDGDINIRKAWPDIINEQGRRIIVGEVSITNSIFNSMTCFEGVSFQQESNFLGTRFEEEANFVGAKFKQEANFVGASFQQKANFRKARFKQLANFSEASFEKRAYFKEAKFKQTANFSEASFEQSTDFSGASFQQKADFGRVKMKYPASFAEVHIDENTVFRGLWNYILRPCRLLRLVVWLFTIGKAKLPEAKVTDIYSINTQTVMDASSNPRLKRYIDDEQWIESWRANPTDGLLRRLWRRLGFWLWEGMSHCGRSIMLWVFWSALFAYIFALIYQALGSANITFNVKDLAGEQPDFWAYLYHSIVTFTTLGFGDIVPLENKARLAVGIEVVFGYVMLGGLISIFANKFARRS